MIKEQEQRKWGVNQRLNYIEYKLFWEGRVQRKDLIDKFGISTLQSSKDLGAYKTLAPENIYYDAKEKSYLASPNFLPYFLKIDAIEYLNNLTERAYNLPVPIRNLEPKIIRAVTQAIKNKKSIKILYQSMNMNKFEPEMRIISPHSLASDGLRWHTRAYCHNDNKFKDFILSRILNIEVIGEALAFEADDAEWNEICEIRLIPNLKLSPSQQATIAHDYSMENGSIVLSLKQAMFYYFKKRLRLDIAQSDNPQETPVILAKIEKAKR